MISFDDNGGSDGSVDLNPIYNSLNLLKNNTQSIWNFVSTLSGGGGGPYLETFRSQNENYMYNITGTLPGSFSNAIQFINGSMNLSSGTYNQSILSVNYADTISECIFNAECMTFNANVFSRNLVSSFKKLSINANTITNLALFNGDKINLNADTITYIYLRSISTVNINANLLAGISSELAGFEYVSVLKMDCQNIMYAGLSSIMNGMITNINVSAFGIRDASSIDMKGYLCQLMTIRNLKTLALNASEVDSPGFQDINNFNANIGLLKGGIFDHIYSFYGNIDTVGTCSHYSGTFDLSGQSFLNNILQSISGTLNYSFMKDCTFESCNNLSINLIGMSDVSFKDCKNLTVNYYDNYKNTFNNCSWVHVKFESVHTSISFTSVDSLTYDAVLISKDQPNSTPLAQNAQWLNRFVIRKLPFMGSSYSAVISYLNKYGVSYTTWRDLGVLEYNFEDIDYVA